MSFANTWLPNIVCTVGGCLLSFAIGWRAAKRGEERAKRIAMLQETMALAMEKQGLVSLGRDEHGHLTGGFNVTVALTGQRAQFSTGNVTPSQD